jgi:hypothetical protein
MGVVIADEDRSSPVTPDQDLVVVGAGVYTPTLRRQVAALKPAI